MRDRSLSGRRTFVAAFVAAVGLGVAACDGGSAVPVPTPSAPIPGPSRSQPMSGAVDRKLSSPCTADHQSPKPCTSKSCSASGVIATYAQHGAR